MSKILPPNQMLGQIGEFAAGQRFLHIGFQFDGRSRLEAGIDGIAEVMDEGRPLARMIAVHVKATAEGKYTSEDNTGFSYLLKPKDLEDLGNMEHDDQPADRTFHAAFNEMG